MNKEDFVAKAFKGSTESPAAPTGAHVVVAVSEMRNVSRRGESSFLVSDSRVCLVVALGPMAYRNRETGAPWKEGAWVKPGDVVLIDKLDLKQKFYGNNCEFAVCEDFAVSVVIERDFDKLISF